MKDSLRYDCVIQTLETANVLWRESRHFFAPFGITEAQFNVIHLLGQRPEGMSQRELSDLLVVDRSNITLLLDRMMKKKWVARERVEGDRRAYCVKLTPAAVTLWKKIRPRYEEAVQRVVHGISQEDLKATLRTLQQMSRNAPESVGK